MCGIAGFVITDTVQDPQRIAELMGNRIAHRGPDGVGYYVDEVMALVHRRLSIIDIESGSQPMFNEDGTRVIVFNGEIYNYRELREELTRAGHTFATNSDTEVILHGYEEYGHDVLNRLRGMFAFAIWDKTTQTLFGARDIFGIKPLYYYRENGEFMFASEIKSFLDHPGFDKRIDRTRIPEYLSYEYIPYENTLFQGVYKVLPSHWFEWHAQTDEFATGRYYQMRYEIDNAPTLDEWADKIDAALSESVKAHQIADVEVGSFLSSGVDSSYVAERAYAHYDKLRTFSVGYEDERYSELPDAQRLSKVLGVENVGNKVSAAQFFDAMPDIQYYMDEPLPNPSANPLYFLAESAAKHVKVVLSGEGADELFGGYPNYLQEDHTDKYARRFPRWLRRALAAIAKKLPAVPGRNFLIRGAMEPWQRNSRADYVFANDERQQYLVDKITSEPPQVYSRDYFEESAGQDGETQLQYVDMQTWMPYDILLKADRMSMAHSLELRVPFLDREVLALALTIPEHYRAHDDHSKIALRKAAARRVPQDVAGRAKLGFPSPLATWLREDEFYERVKAAFESEAAGEFFVREKLMQLLDEHRSGKVSHMQKIWSFYSFLVWYEEFFGKSPRAQRQS